MLFGLHHQPLDSLIFSVVLQPHRDGFHGGLREVTPELAPRIIVQRGKTLPVRDDECSITKYDVVEWAVA